MYTYQDFEQAPNVGEFIGSLIAAHKSSDAYKLALVADEYDAQRNTTINQYAHYLYRMGVEVDPDTGAKHSKVSRGEDHAASNNRLASNFFNRLVTQRVSYSMGGLATLSWTVS